MGIFLVTDSSLQTHVGGKILKDDMSGDGFKLDKYIPMELLCIITSITYEELFYKLEMEDIILCE